MDNQVGAQNALQSINEQIKQQSTAEENKKELLAFEIEQTPKIQYRRFQPAPTDKRIDRNIARQTKVVIIISSCLFFFGFNRAMVPSLVNSQSTKQFQNLFNFQISSVTTKAILSGITPLGALIGTIVCSFLLKKYSARDIIFNACMLAIIATVTTMYTDIIILITFKFITGWCSGAFVAIIPSFIKQITSRNIAPYFGTAPVINESLGSFLCFAIGYGLYQSTNKVRDSWVIMCALNIIPLIIVIICLKTQYIYQSPVYLLKTSHKEQAQKVFQLLYQPEYVNSIMMQKQIQIKRFYFTQIKSMFSSRKNLFRKDIFIAFHLPILRKMTGILVILLSSGSMLKSISPPFQRKAPILINLVFFISCFLSDLIIKIFPRRWAFQLGTVSICICNLVLAMGYLFSVNALVILAFKIILLIMYGMTLGPLVWAYLPEVAPVRIIPLAQSMNWLIDAFTLPLPGIIIAKNGNPWPLFFTFFVWDLMSIFINHFILVETKRKTILQIIQSLDKQNAIKY